MRHHRTKTGETILAYVVLAILSFLCLFFFYILIVNSTRSHPLPRGPAERLLLAAGKLLPGKFEERGQRR